MNKKSFTNEVIDCTAVKLEKLVHLYEKYMKSLSRPFE